MIYIRIFYQENIEKSNIDIFLIEAVGSYSISELEVIRENIILNIHPSLDIQTICQYASLVNANICLEKISEQDEVYKNILSEFDYTKEQNVILSVIDYNDSFRLQKNNVVSGEISVMNKKQSIYDDTEEGEAYINELIIFSMAFIMCCMYIAYMGVPTSPIDVILQSFFFAFVGVNLKNLIYNII